MTFGMTLLAQGYSITDVLEPWILTNLLFVKLVISKDTHQRSILMMDA